MSIVFVLFIFRIAGTITILDSQIYSNTGTGAGGGIKNYHNATVIVKNSKIYSNTASTGGGIYTAGNNNFSQLELINSAIYGNIANEFFGGGGLYISDVGSDRAVVTITNSTIYNNQATCTNCYGGGIYNNKQQPVIVNSILWDNNDVQGDPEIYNSDAGNLAQISYSDIEGSGGSGAGWDATVGADGGNNLDNDPLFVDKDHNDLQLSATSPVLNQGNDSAIPAGITTDLAGRPRIYGAHVDMGAYEAGTGLNLIKSVTPEDNVTYHGVVTYTLAYSNTGVFADNDVTVSDPLPEGVEFGSWLSKPSGMTIQDGIIQWVGSLAVNDRLSAIFTATHTGDYNDVITNTAEISGTVEKYNAEAAFAVQQGYLLSVSLLGEGSGGVTSNPTGINCGSQCSQLFLEDTIVTLTAAPEDGSSFWGWGGACTNTEGVCVVTISEARQVNASFSINSYPIFLPLIFR